MGCKKVSVSTQKAGKVFKRLVLRVKSWVKFDIH